MLASTKHIINVYRSILGWGYGYGWWIAPDGSYSAEGNYGQLIKVNPEQGIVTVLTEGAADDFAEPNEYIVDNHPSRRSNRLERCPKTRPARLPSTLRSPPSKSLPHNLSRPYLKLPKLFPVKSIFWTMAKLSRSLLPEIRRRWTGLIKTKPYNSRSAWTTYSAPRPSTRPK